MPKENLNWNLDDILPAKDFEKYYMECESQINEFSKAVDNLSPDMEAGEFKGFLKLNDELSRSLGRLAGMPGLIISVDQSSESARSMESRAINLIAKSDKIFSKLKLWLQGKLSNKKILDDANAKRLFAVSPIEEYSLTYLRESAMHSLSEDGENALAMKEASVGRNAWDSLRELKVSKFRFNFKPKGAKKPKVINTQAELMKHVYSTNPEEREAAYKALFDPFKENLDEISMIYRAIVKDWVLTSELNNFNSPISRRNYYNHVPDRAIEALMKSCKANIGIYQDFFKWKAKRLGMKKLRRFDIYAPLKETKKKIKFSDAIGLVLDTFDEFHKGFGDRARLILNARQIDSHPSKIKRSGAFCSTISPDILPYVLLNFSGKQRDVSTIAHELGHAIHSVYASNLTCDTQHASLPLAETASTFGEMLLFEKLFAKASKEEKILMLAEKMGDSYATIIRQNYFIKFEIAAHEAVMKGVTPEELSDIYFSLLEEQFGDAVEISPIFRYEWSYIPHMFGTPFYCYAYSFGELLSLALFAKYKAEGKQFIPQFERILASGGSRDPQKILKEIGIDMCSKEFWQSGFNIIRGWQSQLEKYSKKSLSV